jgi:hypothetical protein
VNLAAAAKEEAHPQLARHQASTIAPGTTGVHTASRTRTTAGPAAA